MFTNKTDTKWQRASMWLRCDAVSNSTSQEFGSPEPFDRQNITDTARKRQGQRKRKEKAIHIFKGKVIWKMSILQKWSVRQVVFCKCSWDHWHSNYECVTFPQFKALMPSYFNYDNFVISIFNRWETLNTNQMSLTSTIFWQTCLMRPTGLINRNPT